MAVNRRTGQPDVTRILPRSTRSVDVLSFWGMDSGWYGLTNRRMGVGFGMTWTPPCSSPCGCGSPTAGTTTTRGTGAPTTAPELLTSWPPAGITGAIDKRTALWLAPGQVIETRLTALAYEGEGVTGIDPDGTAHPQTG